MRIFFILLYLLLLSSCSDKFFTNNRQSIKFKIEGEHIVINLKPANYKKGSFYFDTGSGWLIIDETYYEKQKMTFVDIFESKMGGVGNEVTKSTRILDTICFCIGNKKFYSEYNITSNLKKIFGKNIDGIVGFNSFRGTPFKIDYFAKNIVLNPKGLIGYQEIPIGFDGYRMLLHMKVELAKGKTIEGDFLIDTGSRRTALTSEFFKNNDIEESLKSAYIHNGGIGGLSQGYSFFVPNINIDKFNLNSKLIDVVSDSLGALSKDENYIGIIGNDILDDFDIIYHPSEYKIWIKPNRNFNRPSENLYKGFIMVEQSGKDKGWIVGEIYKESDAYKKGLRHNDEIVAINGKSVHKMNRDKFMRKLKSNQKLQLKVKRGNDFVEINTYLNVFLSK